MDAERWKHVDRLFDAARERPPDERDAFLRQTCVDDAALAREVRSLLAAQEQADSFLERPAIEMTARAIARESHSDTLERNVSLAGQTVSHYRIVEKVDAGGMGVVYKAEDTRLHRFVALKFLPEAVERDVDALRRFQLEARAASALNHPNICTIHDIVEQDGRACIVMEYLEGTTLKQRIAERPTGIDAMIRLGIEISEALEAAHAEGITHRDIKSANIFLTQRGVAKVLDFGLAQVASHPSPRAGATAAPTVLVDADLTNAGSVLGTVAYMSPEQARAEPVDGRTDLFSFGVVLYEMATGTLPFVGDSAAVVCASILNDAPVPPANLNPGVPEAVARIIDKCLEKDRDLRYQRASEIRTDLQRLKRDRDSARITGRATPGITPHIAKRWPVIVPAVVAALAFLVARYFYFHRPPTFTDKDTIVLADFVNTTGDPVFDGTLRQGLAIQLEQSPFLKIMDDVQVQHDLRLMSVPPGGRITNQIAHDICVRDAGAATIDGSIASLGKNYVITLQAITCESGATLAREQIQAEDKEHVLPVLGTVATAMRAKLGESLGSIQKLNRPLEQATTPSLEALQNYTAGLDEFVLGRFLAAVPWFERAIALDPNFAMASRLLAGAYHNAGDVKLEAEYIGKAFALIDRVSEYERENIAAGYYQSTGELDKAIDAYRSGIGNYPRVSNFHNSLSENYINVGRFEEGLAEGQAAARLQPDGEMPYRRLLDAYMCLDRLDEARKLAAKVRMLGIDGARIHQRFLEMAYIEGDQAAVDRETLWYAGKPEEYISFGLQAANRNVLGQRLESSKLYKKAAETALRRGLRDVAAGFDEADARADALAGNCRTVRRLGRPALALAMCGDTVRAERLVAETSKRSPKGTVWNAVQLPEVRAAIEVQHDPRKAVELLASASHYERAYPEVAYLRGYAYLNLHKATEAAAEFQKIVDHKGASWGSTWLYPHWGQYYSLSYLGLARGLALAGDTGKARKAFKEFFAVWKDADADIPILQQARAEYAKLR